MESSISHEYGPWRSQVLIRKVQEVSGRFEGNLMQRRSRKLDAISVVNEDATVIEDEQFEGDGDNGLELRIHNFVSDIRRTADDALSRDSQLSVEVENLGPEESNAGVDPLPIGCPLLLVDIGRVTRDIDSVLGNMISVVRTMAQWNVSLNHVHVLKHRGMRARLLKVGKLKHWEVVTAGRRETQEVGVIRLL